jgi:radical SAM protein with 4Fe4S-binding SPASM domain
MCPNSSDKIKTRGFMDMALYERIIEQVRGIVYDANLHHTGESLLHPELPRMVRIAKEAGIYTRLHTNATLLDEEKSKALIEAGLDLISFSFDGYDAETYEKIRRGADFEKTLANIKRFLKIKQDRGYETPYTIFEVINFSQGTREQIAEFKAPLMALGLNRFIVKEPHNWSGEFEVEGEASRIGNPDYFVPCTFPWYALVIFYDGTVYPCPQDFFGKLKIGDFNTQTLEEIWHGEPLTELRRRMKERNYQGVEPCEKCDMIFRKTFLGVPTSNLKTYLSENFVGYGRLKRWLER